MRDEEYYKIVISALNKFNYKYDEDIVQELVTHLFIKAKKYDNSRAGFTTYAYEVIKNKYIQVMQCRKKHQCISLDKVVVDDITLIDTISDEVDLQEKVIKRKIYTFLEPYIDSPLKLWLEGYTQQEIAVKLNLKYQSVVNKLIQQNLIKLKELCKENGIEVYYGKIRK